MSEPVMIFKKPSYPINDALLQYLERFDRISKVSIFYDDLLRFSGSVTVYDKNDEDTLWIRVYYNEFEREEIDLNLKKIYSLLHSDGNLGIIKFLNVDSIDYCTFGNSKPFRIKVRNILNDNYTHFYIKKADASRVYGLELEHILSPDKINFLVYQDTLIEEHIMGIPGDVFIKTLLKDCTETEKSQIAKEFVKFNERCMIRLLGDMRSYNYVIVPTHDFDQVVYKIRAIDFDQQCYEGNFKVYRPQFFKENYPMVKLVKDKLQNSSIEQYKDEERSVLAKRIISAENRINRLLEIMGDDELAPESHLHQLQMELYNYTNDLNFKKAKSMGEIMNAAFEFITRNFKSINLFKSRM
ncbi:hypothetical protein SAMN05444395_102277 [Flavobacterium fryxellicola]|uniref:Uncharacterized protein n=1 Tax=Flavobacterium fryxellicola TaxID=249352 RepID=A0A167Y359_9FLAO|nr:hypothetical protein [Flavobacterium fryxellicola]OAB28978.1 hypothetical protein FBFR_05865 [Flavobacterium fryxellicola]SHN59564.1 hypothetical protein SAMN05444395_102277 [Flavobacterium fryxellicola]